MKRQLEITANLIDESSLVCARANSQAAGAAVYFTGIVRGEEEGRPIRGLDYEAFSPMAEHQFQLIFDEMERRWPIDSVRLIHRIGFVLAGEPSLWVEVRSGHRGEAFAACQFLIDQMKEKVPIWKRSS